MPRTPRALMTLLVLSLMLMTVGCASQDRHVFVSTVHRPTTLALVDVDQNQSVWEMDIPVNHKLVMDFDNNFHGKTNKLGQSPSWVDWQLYRSDDRYHPNDKGVLVQHGKVDLTGTPVRMQVTYRPSPEEPGSLEAAPVPTMDTAESVAAEAAAEAREQAGETEPAAETEQAAESADEAEAATEADTMEQETAETADQKAEEMSDEKADEAEASEPTK